MVNNIVFLSFLIFSAQSSLSQSRYLDRAGHASFFSEAPLENIEAYNDQALSILDISTGEVAVSMLMKSFRFAKALMQEHFNEKYVESDKYPKATFTGKITNMGEIDFTKEGTYTGNVKGNITIHGETRPLETKVEFVVQNGKIEVSSTFPLRVKDFNIEIPKLVIRNIAEVIQVKLMFNLEAQ
jgi:polyisoprenoid-binding protein YceI